MREKEKIKKYFYIYKGKKRTEIKKKNIFFYTLFE